ncbi:MAG: META domain-containing protein [Alphaproteobacteria bacterium]|nr:META domain-containing protein [Alphaproteobacteria bacterium]
MKKLILFLLFYCLTACRPEPDLTAQTYEMTTPSGLVILLRFDPNENRYFGRAVNHYFGTYQLSDQALTFGPTGSTMMMGLSDQMTDEAAYFHKLSQVHSYQLTPESVVFYLSDGTSFQMYPKPPKQ